MRLEERQKIRDLQAKSLRESTAPLDTQVDSVMSGARKSDLPQPLLLSASKQVIRVSDVLQNMN